MYNLLTWSCTCSGMEQMIKSQKESIAELEAKIAANMDEIKKVPCTFTICG